MTRILSTNITRLLLLAAVTAGGVAAGEHPCAVEHVAGSWMFATEVGQQNFPIDADGDITAIGTFNISSTGQIDGVFDNTIAEFAPLEDLTFTGSITVTPDCRGSVTFVTSTGSMRQDSIAVLSGSEIWGMSQDVNNLWTYRVQRISSASRPEVIEAKIDAVMRRLGLVPEGFRPGN